MGRTSIPCDQDTRDRVKGLKESGEWYSYDELLDDLVESYNETV